MIRHEPPTWRLCASGADNQTSAICIMKTTKQIKEKEFDTVKTFRVIKDKISKDIYGMTLAQIQEYLKQQKLKLNNS